MTLPYERATSGTAALQETEKLLHAMEIGERAVPSILRDWIKGNVTALECGLLTFDEMFMPHMMLPDGTKLIDHARKALPPLLQDHSE